MYNDPNPVFEDWLKAMKYATSHFEPLPLSLILLMYLHRSVQTEYLQKSLFNTIGDYVATARQSAENILHLAEMASCQMNIEEALQEAIDRRRHSLAMLPLEISGTTHLPDPSAVLCHIISKVQDWDRFLNRDRLVKRQHEQLCILRESQSPLSDELEQQRLWKLIRYDDEYRDPMFKIVDLILIHIRDDTQRQHFEFVLTGPTKIAVLEKLFQSGVKPDVKLLYLACEIGDTEAIQYLARLSVPLDVVYKGNSPLEIAAKRDHCAVIDLLLELGAENLDRAMNVTRCDRCALRLLKADRQRQKLSFGRHGKALSVLNTSHLEINVATFRKDLWASQDDLDACLVAASKATNVGAVRVLLEAGADPRCHRYFHGPGGFLESFVDSEKLFRGEQQQAFNDKIHTHNEWREKNIDTIIECLSDSRWQQRSSSVSSSNRD
ncbi:MAG: hypothetical protein ASARMPRED_004555 [Alectoria sarmentosa]|nr:MAG: hypothetical protein ASARMPRED_004555 [Alectoria sarmentosa]